MRSPVLLDKELTANYVGNTMKAGGTLGAIYLLSPKVSIGYSASLRYGLLYYKNLNIFEPVKDYIADHHLGLLYSVSDHDAGVHTLLGVGCSLINRNKSYAIALKNGSFFMHDLQYATIDLITSFSIKKFKLEPMLMFNLSKDYPYDLGQQEPRMMINLRAYFTIGVI